MIPYFKSKFSNKFAGKVLNKNENKNEDEKIEALKIADYLNKLNNLFTELEEFLIDPEIKKQKFGNISKIFYLIQNQSIKIINY